MDPIDLELLEQAIATVEAEVSDDSPEGVEESAIDPRLEAIIKLVVDQTVADYGCPHYLRRCRLVAPCCNTAYLCRLCHDHERDELEDDFEKKHTLDRKTVTEVECVNCDLRQPVSNNCTNCGIEFAAYFCATCRLYDDVDRGQTHCEKCGICRVDKEAIEHCDTCGYCVVKGGHACVDDCATSHCPVCLGSILESTIGVVKGNCGHPIHLNCLNQLLANDYRCPTCQKSLVDLAPITAQMALLVETNVMPEEYQRIAKILCHECGTKSSVDFHFVAMRCPECEHFNTCEI